MLESEKGITKYVVGRIWLHGYWYKVEYERLHIICAYCGCYDYNARDCTSNVRLQPLSPQPQHQIPTTNVPVATLTSVTISEAENIISDGRELYVIEKQSNENQVQVNIHGVKEEKLATASVAEEKYKDKLATASVVEEKNTKIIFENIGIKYLCNMKNSLFFLYIFFPSF